MSIQIGSIVWGVKDINRAVQFWSNALNYKLKRSADYDWAILLPKDGTGVQLSLKLTTSSKPQRHHIDLFADNQSSEVERLLQLGAQLKADWNMKMMPIIKF